MTRFLIATRTNPRVAKNRGQPHHAIRFRMLLTGDLPLLRHLPLPTVAAILCLLTYYTYCFAQTQSRTYAAVSTKSADIVYRFGPTLVAVILTEIIQQLIKDMSSIAPFQKLNPAHKRMTPREVANLFTPHFWDFLPKKGLALALGCYILVPLQSGLFEKTTITLSSNTGNIRRVELSGLAKSLNISSFAADAAKSVFRNTEHAALDLTEYRWVWKANYKLLALMPFLPEQAAESETTIPSAQDVIWNVDTSAVASSMECDRVKSFQMNISKVELSNGSYDLTNASLVSRDRQGCSVNMSWPKISRDQLPGMDNPLSPDGLRFAYWAPYVAPNVTVEFGLFCNNTDYKHLIMSGPLTNLTGDNVFINETQQDWAAIVCRSRITYMNNTLRYEASNDGANYKIIEHGDAKGDFITMSGIERAMLSNVLWNGLIYNVTAPSYGMTFWGQNVSASKPISDFDLDNACRFLEYTKPPGHTQYCELFVFSKDLWEALFAITVSTAAQLVPSDNWSTVSGVKLTKTQGWVMTRGSYISTMILYLFLALKIWLDPMLYARFWGRDVNRCGWRSSMRNRTGLNSTPTSITGLAFLMRRNSVREMFSGVDWMIGDVGLKTIRKRLKRAVLSFPLNSKRVALDVQQAIFTDDDTNMVILSQDDDRVVPWPKIAAPTKKSHSFWTRLTRRKKPTKISQHDDLGKLIQSAYPVAASLKVLIPINVVCVTILPLVVIYVIKSDTEYFTIWREDPKIQDGKLPNDGFRAWFQKQIFEGGPVLVLTAIGIWWGMIDDFFRRSQPFASLSKGGDANIMRLSYMHDIHLQVTARALKNGHFRLGLVTAVTTLSKIAVVFSAGIFSMVTGPSPHTSFAFVKHIWRWHTMLNDSSDGFFSEDLRDQALSASFSGPLWRSVRNEGTYWYPQLFLTQPGTTSYKVTALKANLTCTPVGVRSDQGELFSADANRAKLWNTTVTDGECVGLNLPGTCMSQDFQFNRTETTDAMCMWWFAVTHGDCPAIPQLDLRRWLLLSLNTLDGPERPKNLSVGEPSQLSAVMCTPQAFLDELEVTVTGDTDKWNSSFKVMSSKYIPDNYWTWTTKDGTPLDFTSMANIVIEQSLTEARVVGSHLRANTFGVMTILEIGSTDRLFDHKSLGVAASNAYSIGFATLASMGIYEGGGTLFADAAAPNTTKVDVTQYIYLAKLDRLPLYVGLGLLCLFLLATLFVRAGSSRRTPRDLQYYSSIMASIYDSEFLDVIARSKETRDFKCLDGRRFAVGKFTGVSGEECIGIDFEERVTRA